MFFVVKNGIIYIMKNLQKGFAIPILIAIVALLVVGGGAYVYNNQKAEAPVVNIPEVINNVSTSTPIVGGDKDAHGCIGSAGYSWCAEKDKCLRVWEEKCEPITVQPPIQPVACTMDAKQCPDGSYVGRSGPKCEFVCPGTK